MRTISLGKSRLQVPVVAVGCMRLNALSEKEAERFLKGAMELGANFFDHADIYGAGDCETLFAKAMGAKSSSIPSSIREKIIIQSKCGIRPGKSPFFDFSKDYILSSVDKILKRLSTGYLDVFLLHRPDALMEEDDIAEAFSRLYAAGKTRAFGVSNQNPAQIQLLQKWTPSPIAVNQLQFSITNSTMVGAGLHTNMQCDEALMRDGSVLDFCRLNDITVQTWSPFQYGTFAGTFLGSDKFPVLNAKIDEIAARYGVANTTIALAWILRHPARMQTIAGTTNLARLQDCVKAADITLTRQEWYEIYLAAGNTLP